MINKNRLRVNLMRADVSNIYIYKLLLLFILRSSPLLITSLNDVDSVAYEKYMYMDRRWKRVREVVG